MIPPITIHTLRPLETSWRTLASTATTTIPTVNIKNFVSVRLARFFFPCGVCIFQGMVISLQGQWSFFCNRKTGLVFWISGLRNSRHDELSFVFPVFFILLFVFLTLLSVSSLLQRNIRRAFLFSLSFSSIGYFGLGDGSLACRIFSCSLYTTCAFGLVD